VGVHFKNSKFNSFISTSTASTYVEPSCCRKSKAKRCPPSSQSNPKSTLSFWCSVDLLCESRLCFHTVFKWLWFVPQNGQIISIRPSLSDRKGKLPPFPPHRRIPPLTSACSADGRRYSWCFWRYALSNADAEPSCRCTEVNNA
jgi:hypothetical protein